MTRTGSFSAPRSRRWPTAAAVAGLCALATACGSSGGSVHASGSAGGSATSINFAMTPPDMDWGGASIADATYWPKLGLNVKITSTQGSAQTTRAIASGQQNAGVTSFAGAAAAVAQGQPVEMVAAMMERSPQSITSPKKAGVASLKGLEGKTLLFYTSGTNPYWPMVFKQQGITQSAIKMVGVAYGADLQLLKAGAAQAMESYLGSQDLKLQCAGIPVNEELLVNQGVNVYEQVLVVNKNWAKQAGNATVDKLVTGFIEGATYMEQNPSGAYDVVNQAAGGTLPKAQQIAEATEVVPFLYGKNLPAVQKNGFGWADPQATQTMLTLLYKLGIVSKQLSFAQVATNSYLSAADVHAAAMKWVVTPQAPAPAAVTKACGSIPGL